MLLIGIAAGIVLALVALVWRLTNFSPGMGTQAPGLQYQVFPFPSPIAASSGNVAAATATATLGATAGKTNFIEGFDFTFGGATAAGVFTMTITGLLAGTLSFTVAVPAGVAAGGSLNIRFPTPLPASAQNTAIVVSSPSLGAGNTNATMTAYGYQV